MVTCINFVVEINLLFFQASELHLLVGWQCHRLATRNYWAHDSQLVGSQLATCWLAIIYSLACTLVILINLFLGFCFVDFHYCYYLV